jgi:hypothetical protein
MERIRLVRMECDRDDFDDILLAQLKVAIKSGWKAVERVRSYREAWTRCIYPVVCTTLRDR